jgi:hypothetical protein
MMKGKGKDMAMMKGMMKGKGKAAPIEMIRLRMKLEERAAAQFGYAGVRVPFSEKDLLTVTCPESPMTIEDIACWIEARIEGSYERQTQGQDTAQVQVRGITKQGASPDILDWEGEASALLSDGDTILIDSVVVTEAMARQMKPPPPRYTDEDLEKIREGLRFSLNDRVMCNCGPRWFSGHIVGTAVPDDDGLLPYLVKTDPLPGFPSKTISVPCDEDEICIQEVCFDPQSQIHLVKSAAALLTGAQRPKLRFAAGDCVACRLKSDPKDGLETWAVGEVASIWPELPGPFEWDIDGVSGMYPNVVAYKIDLREGGWVYCHRDHHTLIRREGWQPQTRVKGASKRMEVVIAEDGTKQHVDHQTERRKVMVSLDSDSD